MGLRLHHFWNYYHWFVSFFHALMEEVNFPNSLSSEPSIPTTIRTGTITAVEGPFIVIDSTDLPAYAEVINVRMRDGAVRKG
jgi:hypothetical protein